MLLTFIDVRFDYIHNNISPVNIDNSMGSIASGALNQSRGSAFESMASHGIE